MGGGDHGHGTRPGDDRDVALSCAWCGEPLEPGDRFCEVCGRAPRGPRAVVEVPEIRPEAVLETSSRRTRAGPASACADCGGTDIDADGWCGDCGLRQPAGDAHVEIVLAGPDPAGVRAAGISDVGRRRGRNEDAIAMAALPRTVCAVVCDGVASAPGSDRAAQVAADTGVVTLAERLVEGDDPETATRVALDRADRAVSRLAGTPHNPPACTYVSAVVGRWDVTIGWVGDSRAYWVPVPATSDGRAPNGRLPAAQAAAGRASYGHASNGHGSKATGPVLLTRDDSWADLMIARHAMSEEAARSDPRAHLLTGWLGADADAFAPHTVTFRPDGPGIVVICSDGLWNHMPEPSRLAEALFRAGPSATLGPTPPGPTPPGPAAPSAEASPPTPPPPAASAHAADSGPSGARLLLLARGLVQAALDGGGHDNVTVGLIPHPPGAPAAAPAPAPARARRAFPGVPDGPSREPPE